MSRFALRGPGRRVLRATGAGAAAILAVVVGLGADAADPAATNGFDLRDASIPANEIHRGGPPRDGIPALDFPPFVAAAESSWTDDDWVVGVAHASVARAYPVAILVWHELVNDRIGDLPVLVSYCPLCGTALVFDRRVAGAERRFGVSGLLYRSDLLMFDRATDSLWSQISARAISGPARGSKLALVKSRFVQWRDWKRAHPETTVLSRATGHRRRYGRSPYVGYAESPKLHFPVPLDDRYHPKMRTVGLRAPDGTARAYPKVELERAGGRVVEDFAGVRVEVVLDSATQAFEVEAPDPVEVIEGYWFAWAAFHPDTTVFVAD